MNAVSLYLSGIRRESVRKAVAIKKEQRKNYLRRLVRLVSARSPLASEPTIAESFIPYGSQQFDPYNSQNSKLNNGWEIVRSLLVELQDTKQIPFAVYWRNSLLLDAIVSPWPFGVTFSVAERDSFYIARDKAIAKLLADTLMLIAPVYAQAANDAARGIAEVPSSVPIWVYTGDTFLLNSTMYRNGLYFSRSGVWANRHPLPSWGIIVGSPNLNLDVNWIIDIVPVETAGIIQPGTLPFV